MVDRLRKCLALLSVLLLLTTVRCMATCIVSDSGPSTHNSSSAIPPCHRHHVPAQGTQHSLPCQNHPGLLAYSVDQPYADVNLHINPLLAFSEPAPLRRASWDFVRIESAHTPPFSRPGALSSIVLRI